jgi:hypothetical protein
VPGCCSSKRLAISKAKGAIVLAPVNISFGDAAFPTGFQPNIATHNKAANFADAYSRHRLSHAPFGKAAALSA